jgi:hypothetical protein
MFCSRKPNRQQSKPTGGAAGTMYPNDLGNLRIHQSRRAVQRFV